MTEIILTLGIGVPIIILTLWYPLSNGFRPNGLEKYLEDKESDS